MNKPKTISDYIKSAPKEAQKKLREMRKIIVEAAPSARQEIKWGMPAFSNKRILVMFGAFKKHIGFYPTPGPIKAFIKELTQYKKATGSVQFPLDKPLPSSLIKKMMTFRLKEEKERDKKWRS